MPFIGSDPNRRAAHGERGARHLDRRPVLPRRAAIDHGRFSTDPVENLPRIARGQLPFLVTAFAWTTA
ncbi:hypothetical protein ACH427_10960 [Streptomyces sp. NPDC020379]|uniref:hypothetical protein n=1 Tax=Streptomyces sp. NPDC020379 TaxID=3365071 RepID=UPI0037AE77D0